MANPKRQRQDEARALKRQAEEVAAKKAAQRRNLKKYGLVAGGAAIAVVVLLLLTRGGDDNSTVTAASPSSTLPSVAPVTASKALSAKPVVTVPSGDPPKTLQVKDLVVGTGDTVKVGDTVTVQYTGVSWSTKEQFDSSWDRGGPGLEVPDIGTENAPVIKGWSQGLVGVKVGSRRELIIPPSLGYGAQATAGIKPNETLVFVVDVVSVTHETGTSTTVSGGSSSTVAPAGSTSTTTAG